MIIIENLTGLISKGHSPRPFPCTPTHPAPLLPNLRFEDLNDVTFHITHWASLEIVTTLKTTNLMPARSNHRIDGVIVAKDALKERRDMQKEHVSDITNETQAPHKSESHLPSQRSQ